MQPLLFKRKSRRINIQGVNETYFSRKRLILSGRKSTLQTIVLLLGKIWWRIGPTIIWNGESTESGGSLLGINNYRVVGIFMIQMQWNSSFTELPQVEVPWGQYPAGIWNSRERMTKILSSMCRWNRSKPSWDRSCSKVNRTFRCSPGEFQILIWIAEAAHEKRN